jgi:hypothetical protein
MRVSWGSVLDVLAAVATAPANVQPTARQRKSAAAGPVKKATGVSAAARDQFHSNRLSARAMHTGVCRFACFSARNICNKRLRIDDNATASLIRRDRLHWLPKRANICGNK